MRELPVSCLNNANWCQQKARIFTSSAQNCWKRARFAAQRAIGATHEALISPESSEQMGFHRKWAERWIGLAERYTRWAERAERRADKLQRAAHEWHYAHEQGLTTLPLGRVTTS